MGQTLPPAAMGCQGGVTLDEMSHLEATKTIAFATAVNLRGGGNRFMAAGR